MDSTSKKKNEMWRMRNEGGKILVVDGNGWGLFVDA